MNDVTGKVTLDWLTINTPEPPFMPGEKVQVKSPIPFYTDAYKWDSGAIVSWGNSKTKNWLVTMPGRALDAYGIADGAAAIDFLSQRIAAGGKISRIDMAVTVESPAGAWTVQHIADTVSEGRAKMPHSRIGHIKTIKNEISGHAETCYIGDMSKRARRGIIRAYDKGVELGLSALRLTRIEIEEKRNVAHTAARRIVESEAIAPVLLTRFDMPSDPIWRYVVSDEVAPLTRDTSKPKNEPETWRWLVEKIAPVVGREIARDEINAGGNRDLFFDEVWSAYERELDKHDRKG